VLLGQIREKIGVRRDYESLYAIGLALTGFALAEEAGGSGFLAAFAAGLMVSWQDVELCDCFLEYGEATAEMLLLLTFVALGTSLIWTGLEIINWRTLLFTAIALSARTVVLYPVLARAHVSGTDRRIIALFGPRGLSSLLLVLLPVFAGVQGARELFAVVCLVVLASVVLHGGGIALFLKRAAKGTGAALPVSEPIASAEGPATITIPEYLSLRDSGEEILVVDVRRERNLRDSDSQAAGAIRLRPDDPVRDATEKRLSQRATLVVYCA
jgi:NhaP-type Na+/H+ or K+/H+ antiporter